MAHGQPDYGMYAAKTTVGSMADNAELAARLGSIVTFDRKGDVVWLDDFESGAEKWDRTIVGTGAENEVSAESARNGAFSLKVVMPNDGLLTGAWLHYYPYPYVSKVGHEASFTTDDNMSFFQMSNVFWKPLMTVDGLLRYDPTAQTVSIWDNVLGLTTILAGIDLTDDVTLFHTWKLIVDMDKERYVRAIIDSFSIDISAYTPILVPGAFAVAARIDFTAVGKALANPYIYLDDVIITQNEP